MKVRGSFAPSSSFSIEQQPNAPGMVLVRFYENAQEYTEYREGIEEPINGWMYDEYTLQLIATATLESDIENQYSMYLQQAKLKEIESKPYNPVDYEAQKYLVEQVRADIDFIAVMSGMDLI